MWIKILLDAARDLVKQLRDPDSDLHWLWPRIRAYFHSYRRRIVHFRTVRVGRPGAAFEVAIHALITLAFALFVLVVAAVIVSFFIGVVHHARWQVQGIVGIVLSGMILGLALRVELHGFNRAKRATAKAWSRMGTPAQALSAFWFAALVALCTTPVWTGLVG